MIHMNCSHLRLLAAFWLPCHVGVGGITWMFSTLIYTWTKNANIQIIIYAKQIRSFSKIQLVVYYQCCVRIG